MPKISKITTGTDRPVLINFLNGKIKPKEDYSWQSALFQDKRLNKKVCGVAKGDAVYIGEVNNEDNDIFNNFLVVHNKATKKVELIQIDTCTVAPLLTKTELVKTQTPKAKNLGELKKQFGTKKAKRYTEQQERLVMNIENVKTTLESSVADIKVSELSTTLLDPGASLYKPKINRDATIPEEVYQLSDLVPMEVLDSLEQRVSEILGSDELKDHGLTPSIENYMLLLKASSLSENQIMDKCKMLLFIHYLVHYLNTPIKNMSKKFVVCDCSEEVDKHIKQNYSVNGTRPLTMRDKGLCYIIVLFMLAMDYELDLELISKDMKTGLKKMMEFSRNLGFSVSPKNKSGIVLKIPVPPPVLPNLKRKRSSM